MNTSVCNCHVINLVDCIPELKPGRWHNGASGERFEDASVEFDGGGIIKWHTVFWGFFFCKTQAMIFPEMAVWLLFSFVYSSIVTPLLIRHLRPLINEGLALCARRSLAGTPVKRRGKVLTPRYSEMRDRRTIRLFCIPAARPHCCCCCGYFTN